MWSSITKEKMIESNQIQIYLSTLSPQKKEEFLKLSESEQISIMNDSLKTDSIKTEKNTVFEFEGSDDSELGLSIEKSQPQKGKTTNYVIQNNTGINYYAKLQGEARMKSDLTYKEIDLEKEIKILKQNNDEKLLKSFQVGKTIILDGDVDTSNMKSVQESVAGYNKGYARVQQEKAELKKQEEVKQRELTGKAFQKSVVDNMKKNYTSAKAAFENQMKLDGWAGDVADAVSIIWNNDLWNVTSNRASYVREDLENYKKAYSLLELAQEKGPQAYNKAFKFIYGVDYNEEKVKAFNETNTKLEDVTTAVAVRQTLEDNFASVMKKHRDNFGMYKEHVEVMDSPTGRGERRTPAKFLLMNAEESLKKTLGEDALKQIVKNKGIDLEQCSDEEKYSLYIQLMDRMLQNSKAAADKKLDGKKLDDYIHEFEAASKEAFGESNGIQERVAKYNSSQLVGASTVKGIAKSAIVAGSALVITASGGTATPLVVGGLTATAAATVDITDKATNGIDGDLNKEALRNIAIGSVTEGVTAYGGSLLTAKLTGMVNIKGKYTKKAVNLAIGGGSGAVEGTINDLVKYGMDNVSKETIIARAVISSTLGSLKIFTDNKALLNGFKVTKGGVQNATLEEIRIELKKQLLKNKNNEALIWAESHPQELYEILLAEFEK